MRTRIAVALVSAGVIALELALMRVFAFRFWQHLAWMVIGVALLGFGASGTALSLLRRRVAASPRRWLAAACLLFAVSVPASLYAAGRIDVNIQFLPWSAGEVFKVAELELAVFVMFFFAALAIGVALTDAPKRIGGHYAANLLGSAAGAVAAVGLMWRLTPVETCLVMAALALCGGLVVVPWRERAFAAAALVACAVLGACAFVPFEVQPSQYKTISHLRQMPNIEFVYRSTSPLGRIDVVTGDSIHYASGLSLAWPKAVPPQALLLADGEVAGTFFEVADETELEFLDWTIGALAYHMADAERVLVIGADGARVGLALFHESPAVDVIDLNPRTFHAIHNALPPAAAALFDDARVIEIAGETRGHLARGERTYDLVDVSIGSAVAGVRAGRTAHLYTVESFRLMLLALSDDGILSVSCPADFPPRMALRVLDTAGEALRSLGFDPAGRIAMIRGLSNVTLVASKAPFDKARRAAVRAFSTKRGFDVAWLAGVDQGELNRFHILEEPAYWKAAGKLLSHERKAFIGEYPFNVRAVTDDAPYFFHFPATVSPAHLSGGQAGHARAYVEVGHILTVAAAVQVVVLALVLVPAPILFRVKELAATAGKTATGAYFVLIGAGFMFVEMYFLHKLILYLAHPVYSAAAVIAAFLAFAGLGAAASSRRSSTGGRRVLVAAWFTATVVLLCAVFLDRWLSMGQGWALGWRLAFAIAGIAPLAFAMGHMFPMGLRRVGTASGALVPWAWAANGFASVVAVAVAPLAAMGVGFRGLAVAAAVLYVAAGLVFAILPRAERAS